MNISTNLAVQDDIFVLYLLLSTASWLTKDPGIVELSIFFRNSSELLMLSDLLLNCIVFKTFSLARIFIVT